MDDLQLARNAEYLEQNNNNVLLDENEGAVGGYFASDESHPEEAVNDQDWTEEEYDRDPHRECFYDAYRSAASTPELDDSTEAAGEEKKGDQKPLALMDDWELWDYMDEATLKKRLKYHPELLEQITRKRKRKAAVEESDDDDLCAVMERHAKVTKFNEHTKVYQEESVLSV